MKTSAKTILSILSLAFFFIIAVASSHKNASFKDAQQWIPQDFNPNNTTLLIEKNPMSKRVNEKMIEWLQKNYPYRFEIVDDGVIENKISSNYSDGKAYPFGVIWEIKSVPVTTTMNGQTHFETEYDLYGRFVDRSVKKVYPTTSRSSYLRGEGYIPFFNSVVQQYK
jgi:hypothetical protein